jgi:hypothetical protein
MTPRNLEWRETELAATESELAELRAQLPQLQAAVASASTAASELEEDDIAIGGRPPRSRPERDHSTRRSRPRARRKFELRASCKSRARASLCSNSICISSSSTGRRLSPSGRRHDDVDSPRPHRAPR